MNSKDLKDVAIKIQGKDYVLVKDRVLFFNEKYPNGSIQTQLIDAMGEERIVIKAIVTPDVENPTRVFTGYSQAVIGEGMVNKTAALENAETSACGRALAMMGIGVLDSIASVDEMRKAGAVAPRPQAPASGLTKPCQIHNVQMGEHISKTGKPYFGHKMEDGKWCFGR
jgi:hypothetical protein